MLDALVLAVKIAAVVKMVKLRVLVAAEVAG